jgi:hypothetical protein
MKNHKTYFVTFIGKSANLKGNERKKPKYISNLIYWNKKN